MKQAAHPQQVIDRLLERWIEAKVRCKLGHELRGRRGGRCSVCKYPQEYEMDREIAQLIDSVPFKRPGTCPYRVIASHLVAGLTLGPEVSRARSAGQSTVDPVVEIKSAQRHIRAVLRTTNLSRDDIEAISISHKGDQWEALDAVLTAERALENALVLFKNRPPAKSRSPRGRTGALHTQAVTRAIAQAWRQLTGRLPAKDNAKFHRLLLAAITSIFGYPENQPNLESVTRMMVDRIRKDDASRS